MFKKYRCMTGRRAILCKTDRYIIEGVGINKVANSKVLQEYILRRKERRYFIYRAYFYVRY